MLNPGHKIYECRLSKGLTQANLAAKAGIAQANLSNIEKGKRDLTVSMLLRVAAALEVKPSFLIEEEPSSKPLKLTRSRIEALAAAVLDPGAPLEPAARGLAELFRQIVPEAGARASEKKTQLAWAKLKQKLTPAEISAVCRRIEDARQRTHAKKTN